MKYRQIIEENFLIDEPKLGKLVPFILNKVQAKYYEELCKDYDIENRGIGAAIRDIILKARREGFSSLILALFAADDVSNDNPTESLVISYRDEATKTFRTRYRRFVLSCAAREAGYTVEQIQADPNILETIAKTFFSVDANDIEFRHNRAHFYCGTASARTGGRGGVLQKVLFSEAAHYPDTEKMTASEIVDGTLRQVDIASGWAFIETTANGFGNYYEKTWNLAIKGESRFKPRFYGWREFYNDAEFALIASEHPDKTILKQEYPETPEEAFIVSGSPYFDNERIVNYARKAIDPIQTGHLDFSIEVKDALRLGQYQRLQESVPEFTEDSNGALKIYELPKSHKAYTIGGDVAEGIEGGDYSVLYVIDNKSLKCVAKYRERLSPDQFVHKAFVLGLWYNFAYLGVEVNKDGLWVNTELFKLGYPHLYFREAIDDITNRVSPKVGFRTDERTRPYILSELQKMLFNFSDIWLDRDFLNECLTFVKNKIGRPEAMSGKNDDIVMSAAIAYEIRRNAAIETEKPAEQKVGTDYVRARLERLYGNKNKPLISQDDFI